MAKHSDETGTSLHIFWHYLQSSTPASPAEDQVWIDTTSTPYLLKVYDGGSWVQIGANIVSEDVQDIVGALLADSTSIDVTYDDAGNAESIAIKDEYVQDVVGAMFADTTSIDVTYDDAGNAESIAVNDEYVQDTVGAMLSSTTSIVPSYNDSTGHITFNVQDEYVEDTIGAMFTDSTSIDVTYNDGGNLETIDVKDEYVQDTVGAMFNGLATGYATTTYNDGAGTIVVDVAKHLVAIIWRINDGGEPAVDASGRDLLFIPFACTVVGWYLGSRETGDLTLDIWVDTHANFPPTNADSLPGVSGTKPSLSAANHSAMASLTNWTTAIAANSWAMLEVEAAVDVADITFALIVRRD